MQQFHFSRLLSLSMVYTYVFQYLYIVISMTTLLRTFYQAFATAMDSTACTSLFPQKLYDPLGLS
mgnify:CR=1 FL=1